MIPPPIKRFVENPRVDELRRGIDNPVDAVLVFLKEYDRLKAHHEEETEWFYGQARRVLKNAASAPVMYATTREAYIMRVSTVLEVFVRDFSVQSFYRKHLGMDGSRFVGLEKTLDASDSDKAWASSVVADALELLQ